MRRLGVIAIFVAVTMVVGLPVVWAQPLSMGRIGLKGSALVKAGKGLVFQSPKDAGAPLMLNSLAKTKAGGQALFDWTGKGSIALGEEGQAGVIEKGLELGKGALAINLNPGKEIIVNALDCTFHIIAPPGSAGLAKIAIEGNRVKAVSETAKIKGACEHKGAFILLAGQSGTYGGAIAATAAATPAYLGPALIAGGSAAGVIAVAASASNNGGGPTASPSTP